MPRQKIFLSLATLLLIVTLAGAALAAPLAFDLSWWTVAGGGGSLSSGGNYSLSGTIGQRDAGLLVGGDYTLGGGFWGGGELHMAQTFVYLPITIR